jgi:hypothetical protein
LHRERLVAIVPAHLPETDDTQELGTALPYLTWGVRGLLLLMVAGLIAVFGVAAYLNPYNEDGTPRTMETHRQLGLPPCTFKTATGLPCPSCGMTTSFALLMHGDPVNSLRANWVGTVLALFCLGLIPWGVVSVLRKRPLGFLALDRALSFVVVTFLVLMLLRWSVVVALAWWEKQSF